MKLRSGNIESVSQRSARSRAEMSFTRFTNKFPLLLSVHIERRQRNPYLDVDRPISSLVGTTRGKLRVLVNFVKQFSNGNRDDAVIDRHNWEMNVAPKMNLLRVVPAEARLRSGRQKYEVSMRDTHRCFPRGIYHPLRRRSRRDDSQPFTHSCVRNSHRRGRYRMRIRAEDQGAHIKEHGNKFG